MTNEASVLTGQRLRLRPVVTDDADYIWRLRTDPRFNRHLSAVTGSADEQRRWIEACKLREAAGTEIYFIAERLDDGRRCGTVRIYGITDKSFTWGSWILDDAKPAAAALDCALLVYRYGFVLRALPRAVFDVRKDNAHTLRFHDRFGARRTGEDAQDVFYELAAADFAVLRRGLEASVAAAS